MKTPKRKPLFPLLYPVIGAAVCLLLAAVLSLLGWGGRFSGSYWLLFKACFFLFGGFTIPAAVLELTWTDPGQNSSSYALGIYYGGAALGYVIGGLAHDRSTWSIGLGWVIATLIGVVVYEKRKKHNSRW